MYGAFRMFVKMLLMWDSKIQIDGGGNSEVGTSVLEVRNLVVLRVRSMTHLLIDAYASGSISTFDFEGHYIFTISSCCRRILSSGQMQTWVYMVKGV